MLRLVLMERALVVALLSFAAACSSSSDSLTWTSVDAYPGDAEVLHLMTESSGCSPSIYPTAVELGLGGVATVHVSQHLGNGEWREVSATTTWHDHGGLVWLGDVTLEPGRLYLSTTAIDRAGMSKIYVATGHGDACLLGLRVSAN